MLIAEYFDPHHNRYWTILRQVGVEGAISKLDRRSDGEWNNSGDRSWDLSWDELQTYSGTNLRPGDFEE
ncbi:MAG: hypothetical protein EXQ81_02980 [Thermoleophilia bacterium]|nr:hypothetical protein [Thermoleophilia bacterium]